MARPTVKEIYDAKASTLWNILCCPIVCTLGLLVRSIFIYCLPCVDVLLLRLAQPIHHFLCCCFGWPYVDDEFIGAHALGDFSATDPNKESAHYMAQHTDWVRAHELDQFKDKIPQLFEGKIEPSDLCQGAVGDCWLVAAFACAAEYPDAIRNLFLTKEYNPRGRYRVRIYDPIHEKFVIVSVDDRIPCLKGTKSPRFMQPNGSELWAIILEKAYAKFCGSYAALDGGFVLWGWHSMTGDNVFQMSRNPDRSWYREDMEAIEDKHDKRACGFRKTKELYTEANLWTLLKKYDKQKALLSASIGKMDYEENKKKQKKSKKKGNSNGHGLNGEQLLEKEGLVASHAYSIIQAKDVTNTPKVGVGVIQVSAHVGSTEHFQLVQLRNPWGTFEWKGDWSDKSTLWKKYPHVAKQLQFVDADDGAFWMSFADFKQYYSRVNVCDRTTSKDVSLDVREGRGSCGVLAGWLCGCAHFWILCKGARNLYFGHESTDETVNTKESWCCGV